MKRFTIYKAIRTRAIVFGLPLTLFALMMIAVMLSLLIVIFSFSFPVIIGAFICDVLLYCGLLYLVRHPHCYKINRVFPDNISGKQNSRLYYEQD